MKKVNLLRTNSDNQDFRALVRLLDADLARRDGEEHAFYATFNTIDQLRQVVVLSNADGACACGAFKPFDAGSVEIKRMFVLPEARGNGYAQQVLAELEHWAATLGYRFCLLETGKKQPEAIRLYEKAGYERIPNYGQYAGIDNSVCMRKELGTAS